MSKKIAISTLGCKINLYESSGIIDQFVKHGFELVDKSDLADVYVLNSCTVTNRSDFKCRNFIRHVLKKREQNPNIVLIVTGCYAQRNYNEIKAIDENILIVDNQHKNDIYSCYLNHTEEFSDIMQYHDYSEMKATEIYDHSRAFVKVQDGCNFFCTYCAIPYARGTSRSRKREDVLEQIGMLVDNGYHEVVLGGINMGLYGIDLYSNYRFSDLLKDIEQINGLDAIRLSSIEPQLFTPDLLDFIEHSKKLDPHFHIPIQSGSDTILKSMKRRYNTKQFKETINNIVSRVNHPAFGIDVIVGFPGETDELFQETYDFLASLPITYLHVFTYSRRYGTPAYEMKNQVNGKVKKVRTNALINLSHKLTDRYTDYLIENNVELNAIVEDYIDGYWTSLSDRYVRIYYKGDDLKSKDEVRVRPIEKFKDGLLVERI